MSRYEQALPAKTRTQIHFRFGALNFKSAFFLLKFLEDLGYESSRHFDTHACRTEDNEGVMQVALGWMRTYLILKEKAAQWNSDLQIQALLQEIKETAATSFGEYREATVSSLMSKEKLIVKAWQIED